MIYSQTSIYIWMQSPFWLSTSTLVITCNQQESGKITVLTGKEAC